MRFFLFLRRGIERFRAGIGGLRQNVEDVKAGFRHAAILPARTQKAATRIALAACLSSVNVGVVAFAGPALPGENVGRLDKVAAERCTFIPEYRTVDALLLVHAAKLAPAEQRRLVGSHQNHLFAGSNDQAVVPVPLPEHANLIALPVVSVMSAEQRTGDGIAVFGFSPQLTILTAHSSKRNRPLVLSHAGGNA